MTTSNPVPYDYSVTTPFLEPFKNPFSDKLFIDPDLVADYGELWQFRDAVKYWYYGVNQTKNYVFLRWQMQGTPMFLHWNINEKVALVDIHHDEYVVILLQEASDKGKLAEISPNV